MWCTTGLWLMLCLLVLHSTVVVSEIAVFHGQKEYKNHSVVHVYKVNTKRPLECRDTAICTGCNSTVEWFYPNGASVTRIDTNLLYITGGTQNGTNITLNLHRRGETSLLAEQGEQGVGLYHCRIKTNGSSSGVQDIYVGLYRDETYYPSEGKPRVTRLTFHLDNASTDPFQSGPPVFTLTCHSTGGPATTVTWKKGNSDVMANMVYSISSTLVEQLGPTYRNNLTVSLRKRGMFTCNVGNWKGSSEESLTVQDTNRPQNLAAVQKDASTIQVSWTAPPQSGGTSPTGYRIFYRAVGDQQFTTIDRGQGARMYSLTDLIRGSSYMIAMVTLSAQLPSRVTDTLHITLVSAPNPPVAVASEVTPQSIRITWDDQNVEDSYIVAFKAVTNCPTLQHRGSHTMSCSASQCTYTLTELNKYTHYSITVTAVNVAGNASATISAITLPVSPSGPPKNLTGTAGVSTITVKWDEVDCIDRNSEIVYYKLTHTSPTKSKTVLVSADNMVYTIRGLSPETDYTIELTAVNTAGQVGPNVTLDVTTLPGGQAQDGSHSSSDKGSIAVVVVVSACLSASIAVAIAVAVIIAKRAYTRSVSSTTADVRKESKAGHELYSISTTDCVAYGTATNRSGDCQEARDYEIPAATSTSLPVSATACEQVEPAIYEPIPH